MGLIRASYEVFKGEGELVLYCEHLQTVKYRTRPTSPARPRSSSDGRNELPLAGLVVVDMSQFLSGPYCSLRLLDLGARVIKIERPDGGDLSRRLYLSDTEIGGDFDDLPRHQPRQGKPCHRPEGSGRPRGAARAARAADV